MSLKLFKICTYIYYFFLILHIDPSSLSLPSSPRPPSPLIHIPQAPSHPIPSLPPIHREGDAFQEGSSKSVKSFGVGSRPSLLPLG